MHGVGVIGAVIIGVIAGWIAEQVTGNRQGLVTNLIVGLVGAFLGGFLANAVDVNFYGFWGSLLVSTIGAILLLSIFGLVRRHRA